MGHFGAGEGDRTLATGLEGRGSTTELHPRIIFIDLALSGGGEWIRTTESVANRFTVCPLWPLGNSTKYITDYQIGGTNRARTCDPLLVRQVLSQLSYEPTNGDP